MALTVNHPLLKEHAARSFIADSSGANAGYVDAHFRGKIVKLKVVVGATVDADRVITFAINGTAITGGAITCTAAGSAAGSIFTAVPTGANTVNEDDVISATSDGAGSTACPTTCIAILQTA